MKDMTKLRNSDSDDAQISEHDLDLLIAYAENRLEKREDRAFRDRLIREPALRHHLSELVISARGTDYEKILQQGSEKEPSADIRAGFHSFLETCQIFFRGWKTVFIPAFGVAAAICLMLFLTRTPELSDLITESYQTALVEKLKSGDDELKLPWEGAAQYGFNPSERNAPSYRAFGAGLWSGRQILRGWPSDASVMPEFLSPTWKGGDRISADKWTETRWAVYFRMGRWAFLARMVCLSDTEAPREFWEKQKAISEELLKDFNALPTENEEDARIVSDKLGEANSLLENPDDVSFGKKRKIAHALELLIKHMSPRQIP